LDEYPEVLRNQVTEPASLANWPPGGMKLHSGLHHTVILHGHRSLHLHLDAGVAWPRSQGFRAPDRMHLTALKHVKVVMSAFTGVVTHAPVQHPFPWHFAVILTQRMVEPAPVITAFIIL